MDARGWDARYSAAEKPVWHTAPNGSVRDATADLDPGRAVDVAAGEGRHALWLAARGWQVEARDFSSVGLARGRTLAAERGLAGRVTWVVADVVTQPPLPASFDLAVVAYVQIPAAPLARALRGAAASLAPGGRLVVVGHHRDNLTAGVGGPQDPSVLYLPDEVVGHLAGTGLRVERAETVAREVAGADRPALDTLVVARR